MRVSWTRTQGFFSRYVVFHSFLQAESLKTPHWGANPLCFTGLWYYWRIVPQDTTESCPGSVPLGSLSALALALLLVSVLKILVLTVVFPNSGCSCPTRSSARSCCCHRARTWTTGPRVSAIETSSRSVTCAPFVYQVSFNPSLNKQMWAEGRI